MASRVDLGDGSCPEAANLGFSPPPRLYDMHGMIFPVGEGSVDWGSRSPGCVPSEPGGVKNGNGVSSGRLVPSMAPLGHGLLLSEVLVLGLRASVSNASPSACMDVGSGRAALGSSADCISLGVLEG